MHNNQPGFFLYYYALFCQDFINRRTPGERVLLMKSSKLLQLLMIVMLVLTFTVSPASAQTEPLGQLPTADEIDLSGFTVQPDNFVPQAGAISVDANAMPVSPVSEYVHTRLPKFYFVRDLNADRYRIVVHSLLLGGTLYTYEDTGVCNTYYCYIQPPTKLNPIKFGDPGLYYWGVGGRNKDTGLYGSISATAAFIVIAKGFNSDFSVNANKWQNWTGAWTLNTGKGRMQSQGISGKYASMYYQDGFFNYEFTVRMKRKTNVLDQNSIILTGNPSPASASGIWDDGIYFSYANFGDWILRTVSNGTITTLKDWTLNSAIKKFGWNELKVVVNQPYVDLWINGTYLGWYLMPASTAGLVGFGMTHGGAGQELLVDYARLTPIKFAPFAEHDPAMQLGLDPVEGETQR